jgi:hypothetical protein
MVAQCGFEKGLGQVAWQQSSGPSFLGQDIAQPAQCSRAIADQIDRSVQEVVDRAYRSEPDLAVVDSIAPAPVRMRLESKALAQHGAAGPAGRAAAEGPSLCVPWNPKIFVSQLAP